LIHITPGVELGDQVVGHILYARDRTADGSVVVRQIGSRLDKPVKPLASPHPLS
jgi:hypothetical protein